MKKFLLCIVISFTAVACSKPIAPSKHAYVGEWQSENMYLLIQADGLVEYERVNGKTSTSINAPLKEFVGDDFVVGFLFMTTVFDVSEPPREVDGQWTMTVDGVQLFRSL